MANFKVLITLLVIFWSTFLQCDSKSQWFPGQEGFGGFHRGQEGGGEGGGWNRRRFGRPGKFSRYVFFIMLYI